MRQRAWFLLRNLAKGCCRTLLSPNRSDAAGGTSGARFSENAKHAFLYRFMPFRVLLTCFRAHLPSIRDSPIHATIMRERFVVEKLAKTKTCLKNHVATDAPQKSKEGAPFAVLNSLPHKLVPKLACERHGVSDLHHDAAEPRQPQTPRGFVLWCSNSPVSEMRYSPLFLWGSLTPSALELASGSSSQRPAIAQVRIYKGCSS